MTNSPAFLGILKVIETDFKPTNAESFSPGLTDAYSLSVDGIMMEGIL